MCYLARVSNLSDDLASLRIDRSTPIKAPRASFPWGAMVATLAIAGGIFWGYKALAPSMWKAHVQTSTVERVSPSRASTQLTATGYVVARQLARVGPQTIGRVSRVLVQEGSHVDENQVLYELDAADQRSAMAAARSRAAARVAEAHSVEATLDDVRRQLTRQRTLSESGAASRASTEDLEARVVSSERASVAALAQARAAQAEANVLQTGMGHLVVRSPMRGVILNAPPHVGDMVTPELSVIEIADFDSIQVEVDVPEQRMAIARVGAPAEIILEAFPDDRYPGEVVEIGRRINRSKATVPVRTRFLNRRPDVLPDMAARVSFLSAPATESAQEEAVRTMVAQSAVVTRAGRTVVFVLDDGAVRMRDIEVGAAHGSEVEVVRGPNPGARVVLNPPETLVDGAAVVNDTAVQ